MAVPAPRATSGMECRAASLVKDSTSSALCGYTEATVSSPPGATPPVACCTKRLPNFSSRVLRAPFGKMSFMSTILVLTFRPLLSLSRRRTTCRLQIPTRSPRYSSECRRCFQREAGYAFALRAFLIEGFDIVECYFLRTHAIADPRCFDRRPLHSGPASVEGSYFPLEQCRPRGDSLPNGNPLDCLQDDLMGLLCEHHAIWYRKARPS